LSWDKRGETREKKGEKGPWMSRYSEGGEVFLNKKNEKEKKEIKAEWTKEEKKCPTLFPP